MPPKRKGKGRAAEPTSHDEFMEAASYQVIWLSILELADNQIGFQLTLLLQEDQATRYQFVGCLYMRYMLS